MRKIILTTESGSDLTAEQAMAYGIELIPMHISIGDKTYNDGDFTSEQICAGHAKTGALPKTSGSTIHDFEAVFDRLHREYPEAQILHLAYSALTTVSFSCARIAAVGRDYVTIIDTRHVSAGLAELVILTAEKLREEPDIEVADLAAYAESLRDRVHMCFIPNDLDWLRAGGRCSNMAAWGGKLLNLHPCIEIVHGELKATKKYRGCFDKVIPALMADFTAENALTVPHLRLIWSPGLEEYHQRLAEETARHLGYHRIEWTKTGNVITVHGGPGCFGIVGITEE